MRIAVRQAGPGILASAGTVVAALLCLSLASVNSTAGPRPGRRDGRGGRRDRRCSRCSRRSSSSAVAARSGRSCRASTTRRETERARPGGAASGDGSGAWIERRHRRGLDRDDARAARARARHADARLEPHDRQRLPRRDRVGRGPEAPRALVPGRRERADDGHRHRPGAARRRARRSGRRAPRSSRVGRVADRRARRALHRHAHRGPVQPGGLRADRAAARPAPCGGRRRRARRRSDRGGARPARGRPLATRSSSSRSSSSSSSRSSSCCCGRSSAR